MLLLLVLIVLAAWLQPGLAPNSFRNLSDSKQRGNQLNITNLNIPGMICLLLYQTGIFSMGAYSCIDRSATFALTDFLLTCALFAGVTLVQYVTAQLLAFIFFDTALLNTCLRCRLEINTCLSILFYPVLLLALFSPLEGSGAITVLLLSLTGIGGGWMVWKLFRLFFRKPLAGFYILLYLCTLEIIPLAGWIFVVNILVNKV